MESYSEDLCLQYLDEVLLANKRVNLTSITKREEGVLLHLEDSLAALPEIERAKPGRYADLGSGAGFPGVPLALKANRPVLLVEAVKKKCAAVQDIVSRLGIEDAVSLYPGRAEDLALEQPGSFSIVTARALASLSSLIELASPLLCEQGMLVCFKSAGREEELGRACAIQEKLAMRFMEIREYTLSDGATKRSIVVFEKRGIPTIKLPRRPGMAQKRPYMQ